MSSHRRIIILKFAFRNSFTVCHFWCREFTFALFFEDKFKDFDKLLNFFTLEKRSG